MFQFNILVASYIVVAHAFFVFFFFNDTATTEIYTLSLHDALPICGVRRHDEGQVRGRSVTNLHEPERYRSEEHTSELQSQSNLVCRLLLEKKKKKKKYKTKIKKYIITMNVQTK